MFLTKEDLQQLTGYKLSKKQTEWLRRSGISFIVNKFGNPMVLESHINSLLNNNDYSKLKTLGPDREGLKKMMGIN